MIEIAVLIYVAVSGALLAYMYHKCLQEGMIFEKIGAWLNEGDEWYKSILGGCIYCNSVYTTLLMLFLYIYVMPAWIFLTIIAGAFFLIGLLDKYEML